MRAIKIDPYTQTITEIDIDGGWRSILAALQSEQHKVDLLTTTSLGDQHGVRVTMYLDDEGHCHKGVPCWNLSGYPTPLAGIGVILGTGQSGESCAAPERCSIEMLKAFVEWTDQESTGEFGPPSEFTDPVTGFWTYRGGDPITRTRGEKADG